jgi:hypothetical protein
MMHNIEFMVCCIQNLENLNVWKISQKYFLKLTGGIVFKNIFTLKDWYIITIILEVESV